ncbi:MAG: hypothetical protein K8I60_04410, partial [Anaerolineae bacterium]|nr:hypothetical protein [Anaerolineae bacterium]
RCWLGFGNNQLRRKPYQEIRQYCVENNMTPIQALESFYLDRAPMSRGIKTLMERYKLLLAQLKELNGKSGAEILHMIFPIDQEWSLPFHNLAKNIEEGYDAEKLLDTLRTNITQPELPTDVDYIRIMSLHKSKGLTADHVIVTGCVQGLIPKAPDGNMSYTEIERLREEQRRLFYVAITRPRKTLVLSSILHLPRSLAHQMRATVVEGDQEMPNTIASTFISELGPQCPASIYGPNWKYKK